MNLSLEWVENFWELVEARQGYGSLPLRDRVFSVSSRRHIRFSEVPLDRIDIFGQRFERLPLETGVRNLGVLVRDQTTVLFEVITSRPCVEEEILKSEIKEYMCRVLACLVVCAGKLLTRFRIVFRGRK